MKAPQVTDLGLERSFQTMLSEYSAVLGYQGKLCNLPTSFPDFDQEGGSLEKAVSFYKDYQLYNLLRKQSVDDPAVEKTLRKECFLAWLKTEDEARQMNDKFFEGDFITEAGLAPNFHRASALIHEVLKSFDPAAFAAGVRFSSGASTSKKRVNGHPVYKLAGPLDCTEEASALVLSVMWTDPQWTERMQKISDWPYNWLNLRRGAKFDSVLKQKGKRRPIVITPEGVNYCQLSVGSMIRKALLPYGVDLNDQSINNRLAWLGSLEKNLSTLDQTDASGHVFYWLVARLFGEESDWFKCLDALRCKWVEIPKQLAKLDPTAVFEDGRYWHPQQAFAGMGDGFCFELQSLIFWALAKSTVDDRSIHSIHHHQGGEVDIQVKPQMGTYSIFGDDLIVPTEQTETVIDLFDKLGFTVNTSKSFFGDVPFRESCGGHYYEGYNVTPIHVKEQTGLVQTDWLWFLNSVKLHPLSAAIPVKVRAAFIERWKRVACRKFRKLNGLQVPPSYGLTSGWVVDASEAKTSKYLRTKFFVVKMLNEVYETHNVDGPIAYHANLHGNKSTGVSITDDSLWEARFMAEHSDSSHQELWLQMRGKNPKTGKRITDKKCYSTAPIDLASLDTAQFSVTEMFYRTGSTGLDMPNRNKEPKFVLSEHMIGWWS